ncbi:MAG TPA: phosphopantetheine-binding protein, partial [Polyangiaceae bacterium]
MTTSNSSISLNHSAAPTVVARSSAQDTDLLTVLRQIRDLVDRAIVAHDCGPRPRNDSDAQLAETSEAREETATTLAEAEISAPLVSDIIWQPHAITPSTENRSNEVQTLLVAELVKRTGYPEEMLEPDLDLEAELGIDTVKQVASLATVREHYGLAADPSFRMQDARSLRQAVDYLVRRVAGVGSAMIGSSDPKTHAEVPRTHVEVPRAHAEVQKADAPSIIAAAIANSDKQAVAPPPAASASPRTRLEDIRRLLLKELVSRTGYPEDMLELDLDLEAELGIDTVKQVAALAAVREHCGLAPDPNFRMQDARTLRQAIEYLVARTASGIPSDTSVTTSTPPRLADSAYSTRPLSTPPAAVAPSLVAVPTPALRSEGPRALATSSPALP